MKLSVRILSLLLFFSICPAGAHKLAFNPSDVWGPGQNEVKIVLRGNYRYIYANGIPNHAHGRFPNRGNPNSIRQQEYDFRVPAHPRLNSRVTPMEHQPFGIALNGIPFDPGTAEYWQGDPSWRYEALSGKIDLGLDGCNAHVQPNGAYHYHGIPVCLLPKLPARKNMKLVGYAADGFPVYSQYGHSNPEDAGSSIIKMRSSYRIRSGQRRDGPGGRYDGTFVQDFEYVPGAGDLDECNGRFGVTPEYPQGIYHYYLTATFPFIPRYFRGTPDPSFRRRGPPPGRGGRRGFGPGRPGPGGPPPFGRRPPSPWGPPPF